MEIISKGEGNSLTNNYVWFKDEKVIENFLYSIDEIANSLPENIKILGIGSGTGILDYSVKRHLEEHYGKTVQLTLSDRYTEEISVKDAEIFQVDNKNLPFNNDTFDLVITRSVTHYEDTRKDVLRVLNEVHRVIKPSGYFVNQALFFDDAREIKLLTEINNLLPKYLTLEKKEDVISEHREIFNTVSSAKIQPTIPLTTVRAEFIKRYNLQDETIPNKIVDLISQSPSTENLKNIWTKNNDFGWSVNYTILICKK